jgi:Lipase (class 3)
LQEVQVDEPLRQPTGNATASIDIPIWSAFLQQPWQVFTREPGDRILGHPQPVRAEAVPDRYFAWLSNAAYGRSVTPNRRKSFIAWLLDVFPFKERRETNPHGDAILKIGGWVRWRDFVDQTTLDKMQASHLRVEVWSRIDPPSIAVAFGGTVFTSGKDWKSNLRWFIPRHQDEYTEIVQVFAPAFVKELTRRLADPTQTHLREATLYSTGHSLGGGLAQQFAYSLPQDPEVPRVTKVFAFDPSPVTGFFSVNQLLRDLNRIGLRIDRIYERGEILAFVRLLTSVFIPPSASDPSIRQVRYSLFYPSAPIRGHSILELATKLETASGN